MISPTFTYRCAGCMAPGDPRGTCSSCGWNDSATLEINNHLPRHYVLMDRYYVGKALGQGGFGITYLAWDVKLERSVAVKEYMPSEQCSRLTDRVTIRPHASDHADQYAYGLASFLEEARMLAQFGDCPGIVWVTDFMEANGTAYLVMAYEKGCSLKEYLRRKGGSVSYGQTLQILMRVMDALREVHNRGVLHRDISPDNILLSEEGLVKLIDFGAARHKLGDKSRSLTMFVKAGYAPEEQYRSNGKQGRWTDVYAIAATFYRCITGAVPPAAIDRLVEDEMEPPSTLCPDLPPALEAAILKGMAVRAADRYQSIQEFQAALSQPPLAVGGLTLSPSPNPTPVSREMAECGGRGAAAESRVIFNRPPVSASPDRNNLASPIYPAIKKSRGLLLGGLGATLAVLLCIALVYSRSQKTEQPVITHGSGVKPAAAPLPISRMEPISPKVEGAVRSSLPPAVPPPRDSAPRATMLDIECDSPCLSYLNGSARRPGLNAVSPGTYDLRVVSATDSSVETDKRITLTAGEKRQITVTLLPELASIQRKKDNEILAAQVRADLAQAQREYSELYHYDIALGIVSRVLKIDPHNEEAKSLFDAIKRECPKCEVKQ